MAQFHMAEHKKKIEIEETQKQKVETIFSFFKKSLKITVKNITM
jgi:ribosomal protein S10